MLPIFALLLLFADEAPETIDQALKRFVQVFAAVKANSADPISPQQAIFEGAIPGMLRKLDPHSVFLDTDHFEQLKDMEKSTRKGFGSIVSLLPGRVIVLQTLPGTPSARSGLSPGDEIVAINGIALDRLEVEQLVQLLTEARQHQVRIDVRRQGNARLLPLMLTPEDVEAAAVDRAYFLKPLIGYVRVTSFESETGQQIRDAIEKLGGPALKGLVLDLRNNPGGVLGAAVDSASLFLPPGSTIVSVRGRSVKGDTATVPEGAKPYTFPMAVLINGKSASASEIVAGALEDLKRATIIGEQSYGKGLVQSVFNMSQGTGMALTTAYYYTPAGRSIQRPLQGQLEKATAAGLGGIRPDIVVRPEAMTRLRGFLDANAIFTTFGTEWIQRTKPRITPEWELANPMMDEFQSWLSERNIRPGLGEWSVDREWIRNRLHQEIFNLTLGVAQGDEVEARRDPVIRAALDAITTKQ
ncbi:MAG: S41 family peptidase [Bryobacteraceae bacterium]|nr:S41 family peptidase [Bryobacteraceae bacterium]